MRVIITDVKYMTKIAQRMGEHKENYIVVKFLYYLGSGKD